MGTGWDAGDDDLEKLLEFDGLDPLYGLNAGNSKPLPSNPSSNALGKAEVGSAFKDPKATNPCNSAGQRQASQQKHVMEDHVILEVATSDGCRDEGPDLHRSLGTASGGRGVSDSSRKRERQSNEVASINRTRSSHNGHEGEPMLLKQRSSKELPDGVDILEEAEDLFREQGGGLLSGRARDKRDPEPSLDMTSVGLGVSKSLRKRERQANGEASIERLRSSHNSDVEESMLSKQRLSKESPDAVPILEEAEFQLGEQGGRLPDLQPSLGTASGRLGVSDSFRRQERQANEEARIDRMRSSQYSDVEEQPMISKQRFSKEIPDAIRILDEAEEQCREQGGRLLSRRAREKENLEAGTAASLGSPQETRVRPGGGERLPQDRDLQTGRVRNDPVQVDELGQQRMGRKNAEILEHERRLKAVQSLSSRGLPVAQEAAGDSDSDQREPSPPPTVLGYKIPGPAGALQNYVGKQGRKAQDRRHGERSFGQGRPGDRASVDTDALNFREGPWLAAMEFLNHGQSKLGNHLSWSTIVSIKATKRHIPQLVAVITTLAPNGFGDVSVTLKDPTGTINGRIHRRVLTELEDGHLIAPGAVIILQKVALFSPTPRNHYLNITINNVDHIFGKDTIPPRGKGQAAPDNFNNNTSSTGGREHQSSQAGLNGMLHSQTAAKEGYEPEPSAPNFGIQRNQRVAELCHELRNNEHVQPDLPNHKSPQSGTKTRKGPSLPTVLEEAVDLRRSAATANVGILEASDPGNVLIKSQAEAQSRQEAIAKAAGWDLSQDVELLLDDDFSFAT